MYVFMNKHLLFPRECYRPFNSNMEGVLGDGMYKQCLSIHGFCALHNALLEFLFINVIVFP